MSHKKSYRGVSKAKIRTIFAFCILTALSGCNSAAQVSYEWPCFHGPDRTNKSDETGLLKKWPEKGPELLLTISGLGEGYSSVSIGGGLIYTAGTVDNQPSLFAFDLSGKLIWKKPTGGVWSTTASWASSYTGARSTPTYDNGVLYYLNETGRLAAFNAKTGKELWYRDLRKDFDAPVPEYGYAESVFIDSDKLYVRPAGKKGHLVCLDKHNGKLIWANTEIPGVEGYTSPVVYEFGGYRQVIGASSNSYYATDAVTGKLLWKVDFVNQQDCNITDAIVHNEYVFVTSGYGKGSMLVRLKVKGKEIIPETAWGNSTMDNHHGGVILHNGFLYGSGSRARSWFCLDLMTGKQLWKAPGDEGSITYADGMLYMLEQRGMMRLVKATPEKFENTGSFKVPSGGEGMHWAHPVVCGGRLYIRHSDKVFVYDIRE